MRRHNDVLSANNKLRVKACRLAPKRPRANQRYNHTGLKIGQQVRLDVEQKRYFTRRIIRILIHIALHQNSRFPSLQRPCLAINALASSSAPLFSWSHRCWRASATIDLRSTPSRRASRIKCRSSSVSRLISGGSLTCPDFPKSQSTETPRTRPKAVSRSVDGTPPVSHWPTEPAVTESLSASSLCVMPARRRANLIRSASSPRLTASPVTDPATPDPSRLPSKFALYAPLTLYLAILSTTKRD